MLLRAPNREEGLELEKKRTRCAEDSLLFQQYIIQKPLNKHNIRLETIERENHKRLRTWRRKTASIPPMLRIPASQLARCAGRTLEVLDLLPDAIEILFSPVSISYFSLRKGKEHTSHLSSLGTQFGTFPAWKGGGPVTCCWN